MKKGFLVLITVTTMLVWQCGAVWGNTSEHEERGDASFYSEGSLTTQNDLTSGSESEDDWGSMVFGIDASVGRCKVTSESYTKTRDGNDIKSTNTKIGFAVIKADLIRLDATLSYHDLGITDTDSVDCKGYLFGLDFRIDLSNRFILEAAVGYSNTGSWKTATIDSDAAIITYKLKCDWMPWQSFGFSLGYRYYSYRPDSTAIAATNFSGMYGGLMWRFNNILMTNSDRAPVQIWGK